MKKNISYIKIRVGAALGYGIGGVLGSFLGWRYAFLICGLTFVDQKVIKYKGLPGVLLAFLCLKIQDPGRGIWEKSREAEKQVSWKSV